MRTNTYTVACYGPTTSDPAAQLSGRVRPKITDGPAGLSRDAAIEYLTTRLKDLSGCSEPEPIMQFGSWREMALAALARADRRPTRALSVGVDGSRGCIVTATPLPAAA